MLTSRFIPPRSKPLLKPGQALPLMIVCQYRYHHDVCSRCVTFPGSYPRISGFFKRAQFDCSPNRLQLHPCRSNQAPRFPQQVFHWLSRPTTTTDIANFLAGILDPGLMNKFRTRSLQFALRLTVSSLDPGILANRVTLGTRAQIPTGHMVKTLRLQSTCDSNMPSDQMLSTF